MLQNYNDHEFKEQNNLSVEEKHIYTHQLATAYASCFPEAEKTHLQPSNQKARHMRQPLYS